MFSKNIKNIFLYLKHNNTHALRKCIKLLEEDLYYAQTGGNDFVKALKNDIQPKLEILHTNMNYLKMSIELLNVISKLLSNMDISKIEELNSLNKLIDDMKTILTARLEKGI